jgi:intracellular sulfur oxidation DsrE/DsrF family protein
MGGPENVKIALVIHGPALRSFRSDTNNAALRHDLADLEKNGVEFYACLHTMAGMKLTLSDLLPGFAIAEKGGVVRLAELQAAGWIYLRP